MNIFTKALAVTSLIAMSSFSSAGPIDLGSAEKYTLLSMGNAPGGNLGLGSEAFIYGNVGARNELNIADGAIIYGDADYGTIKLDGNAKINGTATTQSDAYWNLLAKDLKSAASSASALDGIQVSSISSTTTFERTGDLSVYNIDGGVTLGGGDYLTLSGNADDEFIVNIDGYLNLGSGSGILLDGVKAENVLFNVSFWAAMVGAVDFSGTYIAPDTHWTIGDGTKMSDTRVLTYNILGNLQTVGTPGEPTPIPAPSSILLMLMGLIGLTLVRRKA